MSLRILYVDRGRARPVVGMVLLWLGLGALVGILSAPADGGMIGYVAGALAGMIVLPVFGIVLGLLGGRWRETLVGSACGLASGIAVSLLNGYTRPSPSIRLYLLLGAFVGATLPQACRLYIWLAGKAWSQLRSLRTERTSVSGESAVAEDGAINP
jgi:hypothetical protein